MEFNFKMTVLHFSISFVQLPSRTYSAVNNSLFDSFHCIKNIQTRREMENLVKKSPCLSPGEKCQECSRRHSDQIKSALVLKICHMVPMCSQISCSSFIIISLTANIHQHFCLSDSFLLLRPSVLPRFRSSRFLIRFRFTNHKTNQSPDQADLTCKRPVIDEEAMFEQDNGNHQQHSTWKTSSLWFNFDITFITTHSNKWLILI